MIGRIKKFNVKILNDCVNPEKEKLGAIGDLFFVIDKMKINEGLFVILGNNLFEYSLKEPYNIFKTERKDLTIFHDIKNKEDAKRFGIALIKNNLITDLEEKPQNPKFTLCSASIYFFRKETITLIRQFLKDEQKADQPGLFLEYIYKKILVYAYIAKEKWIDIGK